MNQFGLFESISQSYYTICRENTILFMAPLTRVTFSFGRLYFSVFYLLFIILTWNLLSLFFRSLCSHTFGPMIVHIPYCMISVYQAPNNKYETKMNYHDILNLATIFKSFFLPNRLLPVRKTVFLFNFDAIMPFYSFNSIFVHFMPLILHIDIISEMLTHSNIFPSILRYRNMKVSYRWYEIVLECAKKRVRIIFHIRVFFHIFFFIFDCHCSFPPLSMILSISLSFLLFFFLFIYFIMNYVSFQIVSIRWTNVVIDVLVKNVIGIIRSQTCTSTNIFQYSVICELVILFIWFAVESAVLWHSHMHDWNQPHQMNDYKK